MNRVNELAAWDFAEKFTAMEAVGLILGVGNHQGLGWGEKEPIYKRMKQAFDNANGQLSERYFSEDISFSVDGKVEIPSCNLLNLHSLRDEKARTRLELDILAWAVKEEFDEAFFSRDEIHRWLKAINAKSIYEFSPSQQAPELAADNNKPVSTRERHTLLAIIAVLCKEANIDVTKNAKAAGLIQGAADQMGISIGESTIEGHLKKIPDALRTRMK
jgi:hypothetical protein